MKKIALLLVLCMSMFALVACGGGDTAESAAPDAPEATKAPSTASDVPPHDELEELLDSDIERIKEDGKLIVGITNFAPMDYKNDAGEWIGFDADMAKLFAERLGVEVEFIEIDWDNKLLELQTGAIDCIWNGMTITDEVRGGADVSNPYCLNGQVVVVASEVAADYQTEESIASLSFSVENGSAGANVLDEREIAYTGVLTQADALLEVKAGAADACVIDLLMAGAMIGEGTSYPDLTYTIQLSNEEYGVAFRKQSDLVEEFNTFWTEAAAAGTVMEVATEYGLQEAVIVG